MTIILPLKNNWRIEDNAYFKDRIAERVNSEDNYTNCKRYSLTSYKMEKDTHYLNDNCGELAHNFNHPK